MNFGRAKIRVVPQNAAFVPPSRHGLICIIFGKFSIRLGLSRGARPTRATSPLHKRANSFIIAASILRVGREENVTSERVASR